MAAGVRERMVVGAAQLLSRAGLAEASFRNVVGLTGAPRGSIYHHFPGGKEELGQEVIRRSGAMYAELFTQIARESGDVLSYVENVFEGAAATLVESDYADACPIATVALEVASTNEPLRVALAEVFERWTHPDVEYREDPSWPGAATYRGHEAVTAAFRDYVLVLGLESPELLEAVEGPEGIAIAVRISASRPDSEQVVGHTWGYLCQVEGDRLRSFWAYVNPEEAFAAAGIERGAA